MLKMKEEHVEEENTKLVIRTLNQITFLLKIKTINTLGSS